MRHIVLQHKVETYHHRHGRLLCLPPVENLHRKERIANGRTDRHHQQHYRRASVNGRVDIADLVPVLAHHAHLPNKAYQRQRTNGQNKHVVRHEKEAQERREAEAAAQREIKELEETTNEFGYYSVVKEMKIKKHKGK